MKSKNGGPSDISKEELFRKAFEEGPLGMAIVGLDYRFIAANDNFCRILGYSLQELSGLTFPEITHPEDVSTDIRLAERLIKGEIPNYRVQKRYIRKNGEIIWSNLSASLIRDEEGHATFGLAMVEDISEQKRMEEHLRASEERFRSFAEKMEAVSWITEIRPERAVFVNRAFERIWGRKPQELYDDAKVWMEAIHPEDRQHVAQKWESWAAGQTEEYAVDYRIIRPDGEIRWISDQGFKLHDAQGRVRRLCGIATDITDRKRIEEELLLQRNQLEEAQEIAKLGSWEWDIANDKATWSKEHYRIFEIEPEEFKATFEAFLDFVHPEDRQNVRERVALALSKKQPYDKEYRITTPNGWEKIIHSRGSVIFDPAGKPIIMRGSAQDITHLREKEKEMMKVAKLESLGILAGGIAHDFNNILTSILGNIELAKMVLPMGGKAAEKISVAARACERAKGLSQQLLTFARGGAPIKKIHSVPDIIKEAAELALRGSNVKSVYTFPADLRPAEVDETQLSQVVNNLVINADQAMPEGGTLEITAGNVHLEQGNAQELEPGKYIRIDFRDQGIGIPGKYLDRIFDPYYSTKEKGSGLGLAVCYSIIKKHGGTLTVDSTLGLGSTFSIFLPASEKEQTFEATPREVEFHGAGRVLVMDDDETILEIATDMLQHLGYQVETVKDGTESLTAYEAEFKKGEPFEALILDLTVPGGMGGKETVQRLLKIDPQAKVVVSSGYANDPIMSDFAEYGFKGVIPKPYKLNELSKTLQDVIGSREE